MGQEIDEEKEAAIKAVIDKLNKIFFYLSLVFAGAVLFFLYLLKFDYFPELLCAFIFILVVIAWIWLAKMSKPKRK